MQLKIPAPVHLVEVPETNNNSSVQMAPEIEFCCHFDDCGQYFGDMNELSKHYCEDHYNPSITSNINNNTITTITSNSLPIPQSVPSRDPRSRPAILAKDIVLQQQEMCFRCDAPGCGQQFRQKVDFYRHKYSVHIKFICDFGDCDQQFPTHNEMIVHKTVEHYKFKCDYFGCTDGFGDQSALECHKRDKHSTQKCDYFGCNLWFKTEIDLSHHMNSHYGDNCYELLVETYIQKGS
ncbi:uncharacterized protein LOC128963093 isoform X2 [Oppia nitens]|uniref:uncharacterized protein LOC128963093 isoform X2 n=1 Tax=Oppia nitens TaxID=1686743 RepID=UPI0023DC23FC|nr:uncharacterized protein LOC128963093 isoform X2 [Oppia nitens]